MMHPAWGMAVLSALVIFNAALLAAGGNVLNLVGFVVPAIGLGWVGAFWAMVWEPVVQPAAEEL